MPHTDDGNSFLDLSGAKSSKSNNPYDDLLETCLEDPELIQSRYEAHRKTRNDQQKSKLFAPDFSGFIIDPVLEKLMKRDAYPGYIDPRNCLVFWARPPQRIENLVSRVQSQLLQVAPSLWLMPLGCLHMTVLEIAHSRSEAEIADMVKTMGERIPEITDLTFSHRARLGKPMISYDAAAIALSFVPAAGGDTSITNHETKNDAYSYHHLRRDVYGLSKSTSVEVASRYVVPSAHLTIARFVTQKDFAKDAGEGLDPEKVVKLVRKLEEINAELESHYWPNNAGTWTVGEQKGLDCRKGTVWYGGGQTEHLGRGFSLHMDSSKIP